MTKDDVLSIIFTEKKATDADRIKNSNDLTQWFWKVGFRQIEIDENTKNIVCIVSRPNQFISRFKEPIVNFLIHLSEKVFPSLGYKFELKKDTEDDCYKSLQKYINEVKN